MTLSLSCVVLTCGDRPAEVDRAVTSVAGQQGDPVEILVIGNGRPVPPLTESVKSLDLPDNIGIPAGRNRGIAETTGDVILFLDDDGWYPEPTLAGHIQRAFAADPTLGIISLRIVDPNTSASARRHVPRLRAGDPERSSYVTLHLGGACAIRREVFERCGGYPERFWYAHEEIDLAWRAIDADYRIRYDAEALMMHPAVEPARHAMFWRLNARNRVWLARRRLPALLAAAYVSNWLVVTMLRIRSVTALRAWTSGFLEGWLETPGPRRPIRWRTAWRMTRLGRPPVI